MDRELGSITPVDLREVWPNETGSFTPWLADEKNLEILGKALGLDLELVGTEVEVGPYWADVLAKDTATDRNVVIENQLEKTNHDHLGKVLTYGAILDASIVVWISKTFTDEHRKTLDWLNDHTDENLEFFGVCVELWRIGDSLPAPRFSVVSRPSEVVKRVRGGGGKEELTDVKKLQLEFWGAFREKLEETGQFSSLGSPRPQYWYNIAIGRSQVHLSCIANTFDNRIGVRLYLRHQVAATVLSELEPERETIEKEIGAKLSWNPHPEKRDKIVALHHDADLSQRDRWPEYLDWLSKTVIALRRAFQDRIKRI